MVHSAAGFRIPLFSAALAFPQGVLPVSGPYSVAHAGTRHGAAFAMEDMQRQAASNPFLEESPTQGWSAPLPNLQEAGAPIGRRSPRAGVGAPSTVGFAAVLLAASLLQHAVRPKVAATAAGG